MKSTPIECWKTKRIKALEIQVAMLQQAIRDAGIATLQKAKVSLPNFVDVHGPTETRLNSAIMIERAIYSGETTRMVQ